jgi:hypothetical protein
MEHVAFKVKFINSYRNFLIETKQEIFLTTRKRKKHENEEWNKLHNVHYHSAERHLGTKNILKS